MTRSLILLATLLLMLLSACAPIRLRTLELPPKITSWSQDSYSLGWWCGIGSGGLLVPGSAPRWGPPGPGETWSGFDDYHNPGSGIFPCVIQDDANYRGQVQFDLTRFDSIVGANLVFFTSQSRSWDGEVVDQNPPVSNATTLGVGSDKSWDFDHRTSLPTGPGFNVGVTHQVRDWIRHVHDNFGFIIAGPRLEMPSDLGNDTGGKMSWYAGFKLVVVYNPALNKRAPP